MDRFTVVLHIFRCHARTKEARLQVALAEIPLLRYRGPSGLTAPGPLWISWFVTRASREEKPRTARLRGAPCAWAGSPRPPPRSPRCGAPPRGSGGPTQGEAPSALPSLRSKPLPLPGFSGGTPCPPQVSASCFHTRSNLKHDAAVPDRGGGGSRYIMGSGKAWPGAGHVSAASLGKGRQPWETPGRLAAGLVSHPS